MADRETVIKGLKKCRRCECDDCTEKGASQAPWDCPAYDDFVDSAIAMLKEQEAIESINFGDRTDIMANLEGLTWDDWRMYHSDTEVQNIAKSAFDLLIALLKEQEPMQVKKDMYGNAYCPWCSTDITIEMGVRRLHLGTKFCPYCGKGVKWDG